MRQHIIIYTNSFISKAMEPNWGESVRPLFKVHDWHIANDELIFRGQKNAYMFKITVNIHCFKNSPEERGRFLERIQHAYCERLDDGLPAYCIHITETFLAEIERMSPKTAKNGRLVTLADVAFRGTLACEYEVVDEVPRIKSIEKLPDTKVVPRPGRSATTVTCKKTIEKIRSLRRLAHEVRLNQTLRRKQSMWDLDRHQVVVDGKLCYHKEVRDQNESFHEVLKHLRLGDDMPNVTHLVGLVADKGEKLTGLLYRWIDTRAGRTLDHYHSHLVIDDQHSTCLTKVCETVIAMNERGVSWGHVHPQNVVIDSRNEPIITGLGETKWKGLVDVDKLHTPWGDSEGMYRLYEIVGLEKDGAWLGRFLDSLRNV